jgi:hypothetical protein
MLAIVVQLFHPFFEFVGRFEHHPASGRKLRILDVPVPLEEAVELVELFESARDAVS